MIYRFAFLKSTSISCEAGNLSDLKAKIECWHLPRTITYKLDEMGEGWVFWNGEQLGYIDFTK